MLQLLKTGIVCKKIRYVICKLSCGWHIVESAKIFLSFSIFTSKQYRILTGPRKYGHAFPDIFFIEIKA